MALSRDDIRTLFDRHGDIAYSGKPVTQREHARRRLCSLPPRRCTTSATC